MPNLQSIDKLRFLHLLITPYRALVALSYNFFISILKEFLLLNITSNASFFFTVDLKMPVLTVYNMQGNRGQKSKLCKPENATVSLS